MTTTLLTGGSGLIGSWVGRAWGEGSNGPLVAPRSHERDMLAPGELQKLIRETRPGRVVHLAWCASGTPGYRTDVDNDRWLSATLDLEVTCRQLGVPLWLTGTVLDHGAPASDAYTGAKQQLFNEVRAAVESGALGWIRPFYVFDDAVGRPGLIAEVRRALAAGVPVELAEPRTRHDFVLAADVGRAITIAATAGALGIVEVGSGQLRAVSDVVTAMGGLWQSAPGARFSRGQADTRPADTRVLRGLGWRPTCTEEFFR